MTNKVEHFYFLLPEQSRRPWLGTKRSTCQPAVWSQAANYSKKRGGVGGVPWPPLSSPVRSSTAPVTSRQSLYALWRLVSVPFA